MVHKQSEKPAPPKRRLIVTSLSLLIEAVIVDELDARNFEKILYLLTTTNHELDDPDRRVLYVGPEMDIADWFRVEADKYNSKIKARLYRFLKDMFPYESAEATAEEGGNPFFHTIDYNHRKNTTWLTIQMTLNEVGWDERDSEHPEGKKLYSIWKKEGYLPFDPHHLETEIRYVKGGQIAGFNLIDVI